MMGLSDLSNSIWNLALQSLKTFYLNYNNASYVHQTRQGGDLSSGAPTDKVTWTFDPVVLQDHVKN